MDATYRSDLRELNEMNFARFDAKLEQRIAELRAFIETRLDQRLSEFKNQLKLDERFATIDQRFARVDAEFQVLRSELRADMKALETRLVKWMFLFWAGTALAGLLFK